MAPALKHDYPCDGEMVALFALYGSRTKVAAAIGIHETVLKSYLRAAKRSALRATCEAVQPQRPASAYRSPGSYTTNYPADDELVALMAALGTFKSVAAELGINPSSLRDYLSRRPALYDAMLCHLDTRYRQQVRARAPEAKFRARPWSLKPRRGSWVRHHATDPDQAVAFADILKDDPCAYCGARCAEIDHIEPVCRGGSGDFENLTASCRHCNRAKNARPMLYHMLRRAEGWA